MFAIIDIETTGGSSQRDNITEIAVILHDGYREERRFSTLLNPDEPIPPQITMLTGITNEMVADAPKFHEVAKELVLLTEGRTFVAHNVNFDYGFIREAFKRLGYVYKRELLCTVRMSRVLMPGHSTYSLGRLCESLGIPLQNRHRAMGDAEATALLLERLVRLQPGLTNQNPAPDPFQKIPSTFSRSRLAEMPDDAGVFWIYDQDGTVVHAGSADSIKGNVMKWLLKGGKAARNAVDLAWEQSGNYWMAGLIHISQDGETAWKMPPAEKIKVVTYYDQQDYLRVGYMPKGSAAETVAGFKTLEDARSVVSVRVKKYGLCPVLCGVEPSMGGPCSRYPFGECSGACCGEVPAGLYNEKVNEALAGLGFPASKIAIVDRGRNQGEISVALVRDGKCEAFGFLDAQQPWSAWDEIRDCLQEFRFPALGGSWIRSVWNQIPANSIKTM